MGVALKAFQLPPPSSEYSGITLALAVAIPGAEYSPAFRGGHWDGKKHYYNFTTHSYPVGLTDKVVDTISDSFTGRVQYAIDDIRPCSNKLFH